MLNRWIWILIATNLSCYSQAGTPIFFSYGIQVTKNPKCCWNILEGGGDGSSHQLFFASCSKLILSDTDSKLWKEDVLISDGESLQKFIVFKLDGLKELDQFFEVTVLFTCCSCCNSLDMIKAHISDVSQHKVFLGICLKAKPFGTCSGGSFWWIRDNNSESVRSKSRERASVIIL